MELTSYSLECSKSITYNDDINFLLFREERVLMYFSVSGTEQPHGSQAW